MIDAVLQLLQTKTADDVENLVEKAGQVPVDNALKILVNSATEEFGFTPRDVYDGVLNLPVTMQRHVAAVRDLNIPDLTTLVETFAYCHELIGLSHRVVAVEPCAFLLNREKWVIDFKSIQIANQVVEWMRTEDDNHLWRMYNIFRKSSVTSPLRGRIFEAIVHRNLSGGWRSDRPVPQPMHMVSDGGDAHSFSTSRSSLTSSPFASDASLSSSEPFRAEPRTAVQVNFTTHGLSNVTLDNDKYYILTAGTHPPFTSFTVNLTPDRHTTIISVFQTTISPTYQGSAEGYPLIRKIMSHVRQLLKGVDVNATVQVAYFLVCPGGESEYEWQMPVEWNGVNTDGCHGDVFSVCINPAARLV